MAGALEAGMAKFITNYEAGMSRQIKKQVTHEIREDFRERNERLVLRYNEAGRQLLQPEIGYPATNLIEEAPVLTHLGDALFLRQGIPYLLEFGDDYIHVTYWAGHVLTKREIEADTRMVGDVREYIFLSTKPGHEGVGRRKAKTIRIAERKIGQYFYWHMLEYGAAPAIGYKVIRLAMQGKKGGTVELMSKGRIPGASQEPAEGIAMRRFLRDEEMAALEQISHFAPIINTKGFSENLGREIIG